MARTKRAAVAKLRRLLNGSAPGPAKPIEAQQKKKTKRRSKPGAKAEREIRKLQSTTELLIAQGPFKRYVREILQDAMTDLRLEKDVSVSLQEASEAYLVKIFADAHKIAKNAKRTTVMVQDFLLARDMNKREK